MKENETDKERFESVMDEWLDEYDRGIIQHYAQKENVPDGSPNKWSITCDGYPGVLPNWDPVCKVYEKSKDQPADEAVKRLVEFLSNGLPWEQAVFSSGINNVAKVIKEEIDPDVCR